jgi:hypothetical protein
VKRFRISPSPQKGKQDVVEAQSPDTFLDTHTQGSTARPCNRRNGEERGIWQPMAIHYQSPHFEENTPGVGAVSEISAVNSSPGSTTTLSHTLPVTHPTVWDPISPSGTVVEALHSSRRGQQSPNVTHWQPSNIQGTWSAGGSHKIAVP